MKAATSPIFLALALAACRESAGKPAHGETPLLDLVRRPARVVAETREILFGRRDRNHLESGWSGRNERERASGVSFVWAIARDATVSLQVLEVEDKQVLVKLAPFLEADPVTVRVLANAHEVASIDPRPGFWEYRFVVPGGRLRPGENRLTFRQESVARRPDGRDTRSFAAAYSSLLIGPACLPLRARGHPVMPRVENLADALVVTGPAVVSYRLKIPRAASLRYLMTLAPDSPPARSVVRLHGGKREIDLDQVRLKSRWLGGATVRERSVSLAPWSGREVDLDFEIRPESCRSASTTVAIEAAALFGKEAQKSVNGRPIS